MSRKFLYDGVVCGKKTASWKVELKETADPETGKKKMAPDTGECELWWKGAYTGENGAFWYKVGEE